MAAGDIFQYSKFKLKQVTGSNPVDLTSGIKIMLVTNSYVPDVSETGHEFISDAEVNEVSTGSSYSAGGIPITLSIVAESGFVRVKSSNIPILADASGFTNARYFIVYKDTAGASTSDPLICYGDFGADISIQGANKTIAFEVTNGGTLFEY